MRRKAVNVLYLDTDPRKRRTEKSVICACAHARNTRSRGVIRRWIYLCLHFISIAVVFNMPRKRNSNFGRCTSNSKRVRLLRDEES